MGDEEHRLYVWVRVFGSIMLMVTLALSVIAILILPAINDDYFISEGVVIIILGTLATSALALVEVQLRLRRNGFVDTKADDDEDKQR